MKPLAPPAILAAVLCGWLASCEKKQQEAPPEVTKQAVHPSLEGKPGMDVISQKCRECHGEIHSTWKDSQHGLANRYMEPQDDPRFAGQNFKTVVENWIYRKDGEKFEIEVDGTAYEPNLVIGESPLIQYLIPTDGGRWQTTSTAWDTEKNCWFDTLSGDDRTAEDWGHWTGRGMTWNVQCAWCHMTGFRKNYDVETDTYHSDWQEMGVGCTQCHGEIAETPHGGTGCLIDVEEQQSLSPQLVMEGCATCHSRRGELNEDFQVGKRFADHFQLSLPAAPHLYYADGQILGEVYVYGSLLMSKMGHAGVTCLDCHDSHQAEVKFPLGTNAVCMQCHATGTNGRIEGATVIEPLSHGHHEPGGMGSGFVCIECHMTQTTYMGNDPRRDHGFHIPDPLLTKELGIPNACDKCHADKGLEWAIEATDKWWGEKMKRPERARTRAIARAFNGDRNALEPLLAVYPQQENPMWKATLLQVMQPWATDARVQELARAATQGENSHLRAAATSLLEFGTGNEALLAAMGKDPIKEVRLAAAWALRRELKLRSPLGEELQAVLLHASDQPTGAHRQARLAADRGDLGKAEYWIKRAVELDKTSAGGRENYAVLLDQMGRPGEALEQLHKAAELEPREPRYLYLMALAHAELRDQSKAEEKLREAVKMDPRYDRAWYNLGLLLAGRNALEEAVDAIRRAEAANPGSPDYPYARATIHFRQGDKEAAMEAAVQALQIDRTYQPAMQFLRQMQRPPAGRPPGG